MVSSGSIIKFDPMKHGLKLGMKLRRRLQENIIRKYEKKDGHWWDSISRTVKWHSNKMVRQGNGGNRRELHRVMKDPENYDYNRDHDLRKRGLWWCYD
ncbi:hypothetical protein PTQ24_000130 [Salmonella phage KKP_3822]|uniref:Uncharacterized protein n=1 Tax=Salmonella phage KKP_3822 TaxID=3027681 RepID=A0AAX4NDE2_9CAUD